MIKLMIRLMIKKVMRHQRRIKNAKTEITDTSQTFIRDRQDYQELNKVHRNTATKDLEHLVKLRILKRTGYGRGSSYEIV